MTKLAPEWVRTSDPVIRSPARYRWATAIDLMRQSVFLSSWDYPSLIFTVHIHVSVAENLVEGARNLSEIRPKPLYKENINQIMPRYLLKHSKFRILLCINTGGKTHF